MDSILLFIAWFDILILFWEVVWGTVEYYMVIFRVVRDYCFKLYFLPNILLGDWVPDTCFLWIGDTYFIWMAVTYFISIDERLADTFLLGTFFEEG